jgi:hypothetical protein
MALQDDQILLSHDHLLNLMLQYIAYLHIHNQTQVIMITYDYLSLPQYVDRRYIDRRYIDRRYIDHQYIDRRYIDRQYIDQCIGQIL